ncbi:hypothetical protein ACWCPQ_32205 [Nocardia sp. NPDC001965]
MAGGDEREQQVGSAKLFHLGAHGTQLPAPRIDELGVEWIHDVCDRLWNYRSADFEPDITVPLAESQWRETCALAGSIAESLMLGVATLVEIRWHEDAIRANTEPTGMGLAQRYLADAVCESTIGVGHRLINLVARVTRNDPAVLQLIDTSGKNLKDLKPLGTVYTPFRTDTRKAWLSLNNATLSQLRAVIEPGKASLVALLDRLDTLAAAPQWNNAFDHRAENFHRWRREHEYVSGVDQTTGNARDVLDYRGRVTGKSFGSYNTRYTAADGLGAQAAIHAREGLEATAKAADDILDLILSALPDLAEGTTLEVTTSDYRLHRAMPWTGRR